MDHLRIGLWLSLLLSSLVWCETYKISSSRHHRHLNRRQDNYHHYHHPLQRRVRALSEFLVPPPLPLNYRGPRGSVSSNSPPFLSPRLSLGQAKLSRNGRYIGQQNHVGINNVVPDYFSKLISWFDPLDDDDDENRIKLPIKDSQTQSTSFSLQQRLSQYAPYQPYTNSAVQLQEKYQTLPSTTSSTLISSSLSSLSSTISKSWSSNSNLASWMSGKSCNPCNDSPWIPILHQYAPNSVNGAYISSSTTQDVGKITDYSQIVPPVYNAKPFNSVSNNLDFSISVSNHHQPTALNNNYWQSSRPSSPVYNHHQQQQQSIELDRPPSNNYDEHSTGGSSAFSDFDYGNSQSPPNYDEQHSSGSQDSFVKSNHQSDADHAESRQPVIVNNVTTTAPSPNGNINNNNDNHDPTKSRNNIYFQRSPLIDLSVAGESTTAKTPSTKTTTEKRGTVITTASYRGENRYRPTLTIDNKGKESQEKYGSRTPPRVSVIDYIVSSPDETPQLFSSNEVDKEEEVTRPPRIFLKHQQYSGERIVVPATISSTTTTTTSSTTTIDDQRSQSSNVQSNLVQSHEIYNSRKKNEELRPVGIFNETEDYSASKEFVVPSNKLDNGKKNKQIIQIIIPYTSQHTPSPFHSTKSIEKKDNNHVPPKSSVATDYLNVDDDDNVVIEETRRVPVTHDPPQQKSNKATNDSQITNVIPTGKTNNAIDVHRLQKNIDNWTIQEYSKLTKTIVNPNNNLTYPRWLSFKSKQIPDEYLLSTTELEESSEYYDYSNETQLHRGTNKLQVTTTQGSVAKIEIINATYPKKPNHSKKRLTSGKSNDSERVYVVTPIPNPNSLEDTSNEKSSDSRRSSRNKDENLETAASSSSVSSSLQEDGGGSVPIERAYQVLPQAVNNLAVLSNTPESAAPALWGIMEHEEIAGSINQPRWRSEADVLPEPVSTPILFAGHSKVSRAR